MFRSYLVAAIVAATPLQSAIAYDVINVSQGGPKKPVPQQPEADPDDSPEDIAKDAARDLKDSRFYNRPGATRAQYDADWQRCRLIARGSQTPSGSVPYYYNPAVTSPLAAGIGAGIGGAIAAAIIEGQQRRANRRACLLINGWRLVELPAADAAKVSAMSDEARSAYFDTIVGAQHVQGQVTERKTFSLAPDAALHVDAPVTGPSSVFLGKKVDPAVPFVLAPGEAAIVLTFRRPDEASAKRSAALRLGRYDLETRDLVYQPRDWKKKGDKTSYLIGASSRDRKAALEVQVLRVTPGDYVLMSTGLNEAGLITSNCFGAPTFGISAGEVAYLGDFIPYAGVKLTNGEKFWGLAYASHEEDARAALAAKQPALASSMKSVVWRNGATYACAAASMDRWDLPEAEMLADPNPVEPGSESASAVADSVS